MKNVVIVCIWLFMIPALITNMNLKLIYKINAISREIDEYEKENAYLKKRLAQKTTLAEIQKKALKMGFQIPEPDSIVIIDENNVKKFFANNKFLKNFKDLLKSSKDT